MLNRVVQVSTRDADVANLVHLGAIKYIQSIADTLTADFNVVDVLLKDSALLEISKALLTSTIWFDSSNGLGFVSHHDDGLVLESIRTLTQVLYCKLLFDAVYAQFDSLLRMLCLRPPNR